MPYGIGLTTPLGWMSVIKDWLIPSQAQEYKHYLYAQDVEMLLIDAGNYSSKGSPARFDGIFVKEHRSTLSFVGRR